MYWKVEKGSKSIRRRICASVLFLAVIAYVLIGYFTGCWTWSLFVFLSVPAMPFLLGLKRIHISYEFIVLVVYLTLGFSIHGWHPWWVLFLTIPVYHILFRHPVIEHGEITAEWAKDAEQDKIHDAEWTDKTDHT